MYKEIPRHRYNNTLRMLKTILKPGNTIFDLGVKNPFSEIMKKEGYVVINTKGQDLDDEFNPLIPNDVDMVTGFEILEHLVSPYPLLKNINCILIRFYNYLRYYSWI